MEPMNFSDEAANLIVRRINLKLRDRQLRISHAQLNSNSTIAKRKTPPADGSQNSSAKKIANGTKDPKQRYRPRMNAYASYAAVRASKSVQEKNPYRKVTQPVIFKSGSKGKDVIKQRVHKRPAVAARRANVDALKVSGRDL